MLRSMCLALVATAMLAACESAAPASSADFFAGEAERYDQSVEEHAAALDTPMGQSDDCSTDLILMATAQDEEVDSAIYIGLARIYRGRVENLTNAGEPLPATVADWWDGRDTAASKRAADYRIKAQGEDAIVKNAEACRVSVVEKMSEEEISEFALGAMLGTLN